MTQGYTDQIAVFHHEALPLPDGRIAVLGYIERVLEDVQGPGPVAVVGDIIVVLDPNNWDVVWVWNAFDHMDPSRMAILDEGCFLSGSGGCQTLISEEGNDWMHSNSLDYVPEDGSLIISIRHQDWVVKIDYGDGSGSGDILWRLGRDGDFTLDSADPDTDWFSHTHDADLSGNLLVVYDNNNTGQSIDPNAHSRGQAYVLNEVLRTASLVLNVDLGHYSGFLGSAQLLPNGSYHFLSGGIQASSGQSIEVVADGSLVTHVFHWGTIAYRTFRLASVYSAE
jgi:hypothetical protein